MAGLFSGRAMAMGPVITACEASVFALRRTFLFDSFPRPIAPGPCDRDDTAPR
jgi:hypothetical protein